MKMKSKVNGNITEYFVDTHRVARKVKTREWVRRNSRERVMSKQVWMTSLEYDFQGLNNLLNIEEVSSLHFRHWRKAPGGISRKLILTELNENVKAMGFNLIFV